MPNLKYPTHPPVIGFVDEARPSRGFGVFVTFTYRRQVYQVPLLTLQQLEPETHDGLVDEHLISCSAHPNSAPATFVTWLPAARVLALSCSACGAFFGAVRIAADA